VPEYLTPEWVAALAAAGAEATAPDGVRLVLQQVVSEPEGAEVAYAIRVGDGAIRVEAGRVPDADVTFTQDRATATAIARGERSAQAAFLAGDLQVGGDLSLVLDAARALADLGDAFASARAGTTW
jgi:predicted lipid carrier protein YhbT